MADKIQIESGFLESLALELVSSQGQVKAKKLLEDEAALSRILDSLSIKESSGLRKLSLFNIVLALQHWKENPESLEAFPLLLFSWFKVVDQFLVVSLTQRDQGSKFFADHCDELKSQTRKNDIIMAFVPNKFLSEKRLYFLTKADVGRFAKANQWEKLVDPFNCQCWIKVPPSASVKKLSGLFNAEISQAHGPNVAKRILKRQASSQKSNSKSSTSEHKTSIFKRLQEQSYLSKGLETTHSDLISPRKDEEFQRPTTWRLKEMPNTHVRKPSACKTTYLTVPTKTPNSPHKRTFTEIQRNIQADPEFSADSPLLDSIDDSNPMDLLIPEFHSNDVPLKFRLDRYRLKQNNRLPRR